VPKLSINFIGLPKYGGKSQTAWDKNEREIGRRPDMCFDLRCLWFFFCFPFLVLFSCSAVLKVVYFFVKISTYELEKQQHSCKPFFFSHGN